MVSSARPSSSSCFRMPAGLAVHGGDVVVVLRPVLADFGRVRMVGGNPRLGGIVNPVVCGRVRIWLSCVITMVEYGEEGLARLSLAPVRLVAGFVPHVAGVLQVVVLFGIVGAVVARFAQIARNIFMFAGRRVMLRMCSAPVAGG